MVIERGLDADEFCLRLRQKIKTMGLARAFGTGELIVLYSGPSSQVTGQITTSFTGNWQRSKNQAENLGGRRIDDTKIGAFLSKLDLRSYFREFYGANNPAINEAELKVWGCASTEFMRAKFRLVETAVCGAGPERVFRKYEIDGVVKNRRVRSANNRPMQLFADFYAISPYETYRLFCLTELLEARRHASKENTKATWSDYRERRRFFVLERKFEIQYGLKIPAALRDEIKLSKKHILTIHSLRKFTGPLPASRARTKRTSGFAP